MGCPLTIYHEMRSRIERAGFINIQEKVFKAPIGAWPKNTTYKDAGKCSLKHFKTVSAAGLICVHVTDRFLGHVRLASATFNQIWKSGSMGDK